GERCQHRRRLRLKKADLRRLPCWCWTCPIPAVRNPVRSGCERPRRTGDVSFRDGTLLASSCLLNESDGIFYRVNFLDFCYSRWVSLPIALPTVEIFYTSHRPPGLAASVNILRILTLNRQPDPSSLSEFFTLC